MAQPQPQVTPRAFSPPQHIPSPTNAQQQGFALPPTKRARTDGSISQPASPYAASPYAAGTPTGNVASPTSSGTPPVSAGFAPAPYTNGHVTTTTTGLSLPDTRSVTSPTNLSSPQPAVTLPLPQYTNAVMAPIAPPAPAVNNVMGPPQRPADRPTKDYEYDVTDSLAGTGIDLRAEEQYMSELYSNALNTNAPDARTGFAQHASGPKSSFYGAGPANQPPEPAETPSQDQFAAKAAERAWAESSAHLAAQRTQELNDPFLLVAALHKRAEKIAREHGLVLNLDTKTTTGQPMGKMRAPEQFPTPSVTVRTQPGPDFTMVQTTGSFIPHDSMLVDQLALLSISTRIRLRELVQGADVIATHRQTTCHGDVPEEWEVAAAPMNAEPLEPMDITVDSTATIPADAGMDADTTPRSPKRSADAAELEDAGAAPAKKLLKIAPHLTTSMRDRARHEREWEEQRLRRRQRRKDGGTDAGGTPSRSGSVAPGTPGSVAPEPEKTMTKKEMKKNLAMKAAEASNHANQNITSSMFAGLGGKGGLFGKKKTGKTYDWMNVGRAGSGASTPTRGTPAPKGANGLSTSQGTASHALTTEGRNRLGTWREDKEKGKGIQLRDWVTVLERDGKEQKALSAAYAQLDASQPR